MFFENHIGYYILFTNIRRKDEIIYFVDGVVFRSGV